MLADLLRTIRGEAAAIEAHPHMPEHDATKLWDKTVSWDLSSEPKELWPLVSNTERLNEAIGLPPVDYRTEKDPSWDSQIRFIHAQRCEKFLGKSIPLNGSKANEWASFASSIRGHSSGS